MQDRQVYPATDLYSVGATCFHLLTGIHPWDLYIEVAYIWVEQWRQHLKQSISPQLGTIVDKLLQKDYQQRYQSAGEVLQALIGVPPQSVAPTVLTSPQPVALTPKNTPNVPLINRLREEPIEVVTVNRVGKVIHREQGQAKYFIEDLGNGVNLVMAEIPGGSFIMGSPEGEEGSRNNERPQHQVTIEPFYIGKYPITQAQWQVVAKLPQVNRKLEPNPSRFKGANRPVEQVRWDDAVEFCQRLAKYTKRPYRLPSEAEWEYACRAGTTTLFHFGETITTVLANYDGNYTYGGEPKGIYRRETTEVGSFQVANGFGLYDMHGNVWEWCEDKWHGSYKGAPTDGSAWLDGNNNDSHMLRGGSWFNPPVFCRSASRLSDLIVLDFIGFRVVCGAAARTK
jgi:formylglycine-generating enzyme required for sulfatase activity